MPQQFGIDSLKKLVKFSIDLTKQIADALADGKFIWSESFGFFDEIMQIPGIVKSFPNIKKELSELATEERQELYDYFANEFDIEDERVEVLIEHSLSLAIAMVALVEEWKKKPPVV